MKEMDVAEKLMQQWDVVLERARVNHEISNISFDTWMRPMELYAVEGNTVYIMAPFEAVIFNYMQWKYYFPLRTEITEFLEADYDVEFVFPENVKSLNVKRTRKRKFGANLNPEYTFETFVVGNHNRFAQAAALAVAESPGKTYNPLYIYGGPGLGKTHLLHSIGHFILNQNPDAKVLYVTSENFTNEVIESIRSGNASSMSKFRDKYRKVDVLMIDDIQFIIGKESTQEEFFHTFNALQSQGKQIVLTSDKPPREMETLEERIRSRFEWGLMADVGIPDYETRMAILRRKVEMEHISVSDEILNYVANNIKSNVRELEGALNKLCACYRLCNSEITLEIAQNELRNLITPDKPREITPQLIIEVVTEHFNISMAQMVSKNRSNAIARPRQIAMFLCKDMTDTSLDVIGSLLGGRDHSTVIHGVKKIAEEYKADENIKELIEGIREKICRERSGA